MVSLESRKQVAFRIPTPADGHAAWEMVKNDRGLDTNSPYFYMTWFRDFAHSSVVATVGERLVGFLTGYRRPEQPDTYFVWQVVVAPRHGIPDLELKIFGYAAEKQMRTGARFIETTVSAGNQSVVMDLKKFADAHFTQIEHQVLFPSSAFPVDHQDEVLYRIGPLKK